MEKVKVKRKIHDFDFEGEGASVHLVSKSQGGAANGHKVLIMKSKATEDCPEVKLDNISKAKLEQIKVTMSMEEFLRKFFDMYYSDAELLTAMLGFETEAESFMDNTPEPVDYQNYLKEKVSSFEIMKSMYDGNAEELSGLDFLTVLELQEKIEKNFKEETMDKITIEKSRFEALEKAEKDAEAQVELVKSLEADKEALQKNLQDAEGKIKQMETEQAEQSLQKAKDLLKDLVEEDKLEKLAKSLVALDQESADIFVDSLKAKKDQIEKSNLFDEMGHGKDVKTQDKEKAFEESLRKALSEDK